MGGSRSLRVAVRPDVHAGIALLNVGERLVVPVLVTGRREAEQVALAHGRSLDEFAPSRLQGHLGPGHLAHPVVASGGEVGQQHEAALSPPLDGRAAVQDVGGVQEHAPCRPGDRHLVVEEGAHLELPRHEGDGVADRSRDHLRRTIVLGHVGQHHDPRPGILRRAQGGRPGHVGALMKGALHTDELLHEVLKRDTGLRTERCLSHVMAFDVPTYPRPLLITDAAINIYPKLAEKRDIVQNAIELAHALGNDNPRVAILSAVETVNPKITSTIDAAALCKMAERGQISGGTLDGPLAFDNAVSEAAARTKGIVSSVAGRADILLAPDLEAANMLMKQLTHLADATGAGVVIGARVPIMLTSRADDALTRMASSALALLFADYQRRSSLLSSPSGA